MENKDTAMTETVSPPNVADPGPSPKGNVKSPQVIASPIPDESPAPQAPLAPQVSAAAPSESAPALEEKGVSDYEIPPPPPAEDSDDNSDDEDFVSKEKTDQETFETAHSTATTTEHTPQTQNALETISTPILPPSSLQPGTPQRQKIATDRAAPGRPPLSPKITPRSVKKELVTSNKKSVIPFLHDPNKITLKFLFANKDGLSVQLQFTPSDTVGEVKGSLLSMWPDTLPPCSGGGEALRLICMGKGVLMPDSRSLKDCEVPVFETHATPINVSVRPSTSVPSSTKKGDTDKKGQDYSNATSGSNAAQTSAGSGGSTGNTGGGQGNINTVDQGCACIIL